MRFGIPDPDDSDGYEPAVLDLAYLSDESDDHVPDFSRCVLPSHRYRGFGTYRSHKSTIC
jgi:hypothetical protein